MVRRRASRHAVRAPVRGVPDCRAADRSSSTRTSPRSRTRSQGHGDDENAEVGRRRVTSVTFVLDATRSPSGTDVRRQQRTRIATRRRWSPTFTHVAVPLAHGGRLHPRQTSINTQPVPVPPGQRGSIFIGDRTTWAPHRLDVGPRPARGSRCTSASIPRSPRRRDARGRRRPPRPVCSAAAGSTTYDYRMEIRQRGTGKTLSPGAVGPHPRLPHRPRPDRGRDHQPEPRPRARIASSTLETDEFTRGLLKWNMLAVPPTSGAPGSAFTVTYGVRVVRAKDVDMTPLPE